MTRPSPGESATLYATGTRRRGADGRTWIVTETRTGVKRWVAAAKTSPRRTDEKPNVVCVVDNGAIPFVVYMYPSTSTAKVMTARDADADVDLRDPATHAEWLKETMQFRFKRAWIGVDPSEGRPPTLLSRLFPKKSKFGGTAVLLQLTKRRHVYIGSEIFEFQAADEIVEFTSHMGNNEVPYPWAVGTKNTYLLLERTWIENEALARCPGEDPYDRYYNCDVGSGERLPYKTHIRRLQALHKAHERLHRLPGFKLLCKRQV